MDHLGIDRIGAGRIGWTAVELEAMTVSERYDLFMQFDDAPEIAFRARAILEGS